MWLLITFLILLGFSLFVACAIYMLDPEGRGIKVSALLFLGSCLSIGTAIYAGLKAMGFVA